jgi:hypothetical protein
VAILKTPRELPLAFHFEANGASWRTDFATYRRLFQQKESNLDHVFGCYFAAALGAGRIVRNPTPDPLPSPTDSKKLS